MSVEAGNGMKFEYSYDMDSIFVIRGQSCNSKLLIIYTSPNFPMPFKPIVVPHNSSTKIQKRTHTPSSIQTITRNTTKID